MLDVHRRAVRITAGKDYPPSVISEWAALPVTDQDVARFDANADGEVRRVVEIDGKIVGMGAIVPAKNELRACYVDPDFAGRGVGRALIRELEAEALRLGVDTLEMDSSTTAEPFYQACGFNVVSEGEHTLRNGGRMACVRMMKRL